MMLYAKKKNFSVILRVSFSVSFLFILHLFFLSPSPLPLAFSFSRFFEMSSPPNSFGLQAHGKAKNVFYIILNHEAVWNELLESNEPLL